MQSFELADIGRAWRQNDQYRPLLNYDDSDNDDCTGGGGFGGTNVHRGRSSIFAAEQTRQEMGCLSVTNSLVIVPQDRYYALERFGRFTQMLPPGLSFTSLDCLGCCVSLRSISSRITQLIVEVNTKTKDHVFVTAKIAVQKSVLPEGVVDAMYKLTDVHAQVESYVSDVVRSTLPQMTLFEVFEKKDHVSEAVLRHLTTEMRAYGFQIHRALVVDISPDIQVVHAMNEISVQNYLRDAAICEAEGEKIRLIRAAEGAADTAQLYGEGVARQRKAIIEGLKASIMQGGEGTKPLSTEELCNLLVITQYFETIREIAERSAGSLVFLPHDPGAVRAASAEVYQGLQMGRAPGQAKMA
mmetsp:Transcript_51299/g.166354  ORF Transcript_51299/g.166354 Transcript_51299/m.166354 type:complete len:356 (-) Transcript_51299:77-1144(-)